MYLKEISGAIPVQIYWMSRICCIYWTTNQLKLDPVTSTGGEIWIYYPHLFLLDNCSMMVFEIAVSSFLPINIS
jgi:hypothetical protein